MIVLSKFIPNLSMKADEMWKLLKKVTPWEKTSKRNHDFNAFKQELANLPCLADYSGLREEIVNMEACTTGLGVAPWLKHADGKMKAEN